VLRKLVLGSATRASKTFHSEIDHTVGIQDSSTGSATHGVVVDESHVLDFLQRSVKRRWWDDHTGCSNLVARPEVP
jgi:hypothetical protein